VVGNQSVWLESRTLRPVADLPFPGLGDGERAAIALAQAIGATLVLIDDRAGAAVARSQGLATTGTLGVLELAAMSGLVDLPSAVARLQGTNFRYRPELLEMLLARHRDRDSRL
jgi:predicted nucleic acid-binding protein